MDVKTMSEKYMEKMFRQGNNMANMNEQMKDELSEKVNRLGEHMSTDKFKNVIIFGALCFLAGYMFKAYLLTGSALK
jgi:hypothetical protein